MTLESRPQAVVFWNTWYRAEVSDQFAYLQTVQQQLGARGIDDVLLCLSEATVGQGAGLVDALDTAGYDTHYRPTSDIRIAGRPMQEGLCFASQQPLDVEFTKLRTARAIVNSKTRWLGKTVMGDVSVFSAHLSYTRPTRTETDGVVKQLQADTERTDNPLQLLGGDFNTVSRVKSIITRLEASGLQKIRAEGKPHTMAVGPFGGGIETDHALVSPGLLEHAQLEILPEGPSNHKLLVVTLS